MGFLFWMAAGSVLRAGALQTFTVEDHLGRHWENEIVHFDFDVADTGDLKLTDEAGQAVSAQFSGVKTGAGHTKGRVWTLANLKAGGKAVFELQSGPGAAKTDLRVEAGESEVVLSNGLMAVRLPRWPGTLKAGGDLQLLPAPLVSVRGRSGDWLGGAKWFNDGGEMKVKEAATTVLEQGPVRAVVRQHLVLEDGRHYTCTIELGASQEVALIREDSDIDAPKAGWRLSLQPGLGANHVFWNNQWKATEKAGTFALADTPVDFQKENVVAKLRPWSFWWLGDITIYAGFYQQGADPFVGVLMLNPANWLPGDWDGFDRTEIPIVAGPGGRLEMSFPLLATRMKDSPSKPSLIMKEPDLVKFKVLMEQYKDVDVPMHREWGITAGTVGEHVLDPKVAKVGTPEGTTKLRRELLKYGEFPLDEVKDYGFDFQTLNAGKAHPFLLISPQDVERVRRQVKTDPALRAQVDTAIKYIATSGAIAALEKGGAALEGQFTGLDFVQKLSEAYLGSDDPVYGKLLAAAVVNMTRSIRKVFIEAPSRPALVSYGPWPAEEFTRFLFAYDLIAGSGLLTPEQDKTAYDTLVFGAHVLAHRNYWNLEHGLASANPNMTSMIRLPLGLLGLYLAGHPEADGWVKGAEEELKHEIADWIFPGGAFLEPPGYQAASLDGMLLMGTALRNVHGRDHLISPNFKATMEYYGFLLTPPDRRYPPRPMPDIPTLTHPGAQPPSILPTIGDTPTGAIHPFNGWMAQATAASDPAFSKRQQFFWKMQGMHYVGGNRGKGFLEALANVELPAEPPMDLSRKFPGFGSIMRTSWTDPRASYVAHRTGPASHHYHDDYNSFTYYAKGAPLCLDFGNQYQPVRRDEPWYHNRVSYAVAGKFDDFWGGTGEIVDLRTLPLTIDYSHGKSSGKNGEQNDRSLLLIKSADPLGANYLVVRDATAGGPADQKFYWNLWCLSKEPKIEGSTVHFPGQMGVDLDVHVLEPSAPVITTDQWNWKKNTGTWGDLSEEQFGMRIAKTGAAGDFLVVLYPRAEGQGPAKVSALAGGAAMLVEHSEGTDVVMLSPGHPAEAANESTTVQGEVAFARKNKNGTIRLALVKGPGKVACAGWGLEGSEPAALEITGKNATGESDGAARNLTITLPPGHGPVKVMAGGKPIQSSRKDQVLAVPLPAGPQKFSIDPA